MTLARRAAPSRPLPPRRTLRRFVAIAGALLVVCGPLGCMTFASHEARILDPFPPEHLHPRGTRDRIAVTTSIATEGFPAATQYEIVVLEAVNQTLGRALSETGTFDYSREPRKTDYRLDVEITARVFAKRWWLLLARFTAFLIPARTPTSFTTQMNLVNEKTGEVKARVWTHELVVWQQFFLMFGSPFATYRSVSREMWNDIFRDAAVWAAEQSGEPR